MKQNFRKFFAPITLIGIFALVLCGGLLLTACGHQHSFSEWMVDKAATCTEPGLEKRICKCGEEETRTINALGHNMSAWASLKEEDDNDCDGTHEQHCQNPGCDLQIIEECEYETEQTEPTCTEPGHHEHVCPKCGDFVSHDYADAIGHTWSGQWVEAGKNQNGEFIHTQRCLNVGCNEVLTGICSFDEEHMTEEEATCTTKGTKTYTCTACGQQKVETTQNELGHEFPQEWTYSETTPEGHHEHKCNRCDEVEFNLCTPERKETEASCTQPGEIFTECTVCSRHTTLQTSAQLEHVWKFEHESGSSEQDSKHKKTCELCGEEENGISCEFVTTPQEATCTEKGKDVRHCMDCQFSYETENGEALGHQYDSGYEHYEEDGVHKHKKTCSRCGEITSQECQFVQTTNADATCTEKGEYLFTCSLAECGFSYTEEIPELGHLWAESEDDKEEWVITDTDHTRTCKRAECGESETSEHTFTQTNHCDSCGYDGLEYKEMTGYAVVLRDNRVTSAKKIIVAETYNGLPVEEIMSGLETYDGRFSGFFMNTTVQEVVLPKTIKRIGSHAFESCTNLEKVTVDLKAGEKAALLTIEESAFAGCGKLTVAPFTDGLTTIGESAFQNCYKLANISIPESVSTIGDHAFHRTAFIDNPSNWSGDVLYINKHLIRAKSDLGEEYEVVEGTLTISAQAFADCTGLKSIILPAELVDVGEDAFKNCTLLEKVVFKGSFQQWISINFENDYSSPMCHAHTLTIEGAKEDISIPSIVTYIPAGAFKGTEIASVHIPKSVKKIGEEAFENCASLTTVEWDEDCNIEYIGENAFAGTPYFEEQMKNGVLYVGHCLVKANDKLPVDADGKYVVEEGTYSIAPHAFENNQKIKFVVLPESLQYIGEKAFSGSSLERAEFKNPNGWYAFMLQGAGRSPYPSVLGAAGENEETKNSNRRQAAQLLTQMYQSYWRKNLSK